MAGRGSIAWACAQCLVASQSTHAKPKLHAPREKTHHHHHNNTHNNNTTQHNTTQHNTTQHNTTQHNTQNNNNTTQRTTTALNIPALNYKTASIFGVPIPPPLNIAIEPRRFEGVLDASTGVMELKFAAQFVFTAGARSHPRALSRALS